MTMTVAEQLRPLLDTAIQAYAGRPFEPILRDAVDRLDAPLRVAIAGRVKAGKSTLLNALVGEELAPTDAGECTRIVTWYRDGHTYQVLMEPTDGGPAVQVPFRRDNGALEVDLGDRPAAQVARLLVDWPSQRLRNLTLIDTPGIASINTEVSERAVRFLAPGDERPTQADAVLYLLRHVHREDVRFLEAFHDDDVAHATPINAVAVLSRADEIGVCRLDALDSARRIAASWRADRRLRRLVQTIVPVAGLLAQAGATLTEAEYRTLRSIAALGAEERDDLLLTVDHVVADHPNCAAVPEQRRHVLQRLGLFGLRMGVQALVEDPSTTATQLAHAMLSASGLEELRAILASQLASRSHVLKARTAALTLQQAVESDPLPGSGELANQLEAIVARDHEVAELRLLGQLRGEQVTLRADDLLAAERLLGTEGLAVPARLGLPADALDQDVSEVRHVATDELARWQRRAESPMATKEARDAARLLVRTCEGILADLTPA